MELVTAAWIAAALGTAKVGTWLGLLAVVSRRKAQRSAKSDAAPDEATDSDTEPLVRHGSEMETLNDR